MKILKQCRPAFTMVELIFVMIVLGIVASIGSEIIFQVYDGYIIQKAEHKATSKTELALNQIANRLRYAIPGTVSARADKNAMPVRITELTGQNDKVMEWVGYDGDSFNAISSSSDRKPGWSGFCDLNASTSTTIATPGSNLDLAKSIISNLGGDIKDAAIFFPYENGKSRGISDGSGESITLDNAIASGDRIYERYKLSWSSYALEVDGNNDLILHYGLKPTVNAPLDQKSVLLLKHVTVFRFEGSEGSIRIKICKEEQIGTGNKIHACKEKVVF